MKIHEFTTRGESGEVYQEFTLSFRSREEAQKRLDAAAEVERLKREAQDARRAAFEEAAGIAETNRFSFLPDVWTVRAIAAAIRAHIDQSAKTPDHAFVSGDPACGWERQCAVVVPVIECGRVVGAHCGLPPEAHALWASARAEEAAAIRAASKEER